MTTMNNTTQQTTFWKFLSEHTIEIPIIQRDYAQGRKDKISLRKGFLGDLKKALDRNLPNGEKNLKLDFVYGSTENGKLQPLDGQQRLTTLWLLHWYIALLAGKLEEAAPVLSKFTYETRISSREFCKQLCMPDNFQTLDPSEKIVPYITNQTWFFSAWKQDPTIQAMLTMLSGTPDKAKNGEEIIDGLEEAFTCKDCLPNDSKQCNFGSYWELLTSDSCPIIFYYLDLLGLKLSDDLYIKMNARGKQLTSFENFKADLIKYINEKKESSLTDEEKNKWNTLLDPEEGLPIKMDTTWMDIFWKNKSEDFRVDEIYFAFLNRFFLNDYIVNAGIPADDIGNQFTFNALYGEKSDDSALQYTSEVPYKRNNASSYENLRSIIDNFVQSDQDITQYFPEWSKEQTFDFIPVYKSDGISTLTQKQRIVFYAICVFLEKSPIQNETAKKFKEWMRVVWNIVENANIETIPAMVGCMRLIKELSNECVNIYGFLTKCNLKSDFAKDQVQEEIAKVRQILDENGDLRKYEGRCEHIQGEKFNTWEDVIIQAESYAFFKGAIRFLFRDENGGWDWKDFDEKWKNAQEYFDGKGVKDKYKTILIKSLVIQCANWDNQLYNKQIFNPNASTWKWIMCADEWRAAINNILSDIKYILPVQNKEHPVLKLLQYLPYETLVQKRPRGRFRWNGRLGFYEPYEQNAIAFDWSDFRRNEILSALINEEKIQCTSLLDNINDHCFFEGWDVDFSYCNHTFRWHQNNYVYLMNQDPKNPNGYTYRDQNEKEELEIYCCFNAKDIVVPEQFIEHLNGLIEEQEERALAQCTDQTSEQPAEQ